MSIEIPSRAQLDDVASEDVAAHSGEAVAGRFQGELTRLLGRLETLPESAAEVEPPYPGTPA